VPFRRPSHLALLAVLSGAFLRFHQLGVVPPGLHYDFAANAIIANDIAFNNWRDVFVTAYTGKEVLFFYTAGLLFNLIGPSIFALQLTAALYGVLGIASCYFAARQLFHDDADSKWIAAFAAAILSFTFMHLVWSRYGERATTEPFVQGLAIGFLFRGLRLHHREHGAHREKENKNSVFAVNSVVSMALAGVFTGLAAYTYLAARLFPIPIAITLLAFLIGEAHRSTTRPFDHSTIRLFGVYLLAAVFVFAPLGLFFLQHPEAFLTRANQLTPREGEGNLLWQSVTGALGMIFISGEPYDRFNIPGRPIFGPLLGLFFVIGLGLILRNLLRSLRTTHYTIRNTQYSIPNTQYASRFAFYVSLFVLVYTLTFLIPTAISVHDIFPSNVRSMGLWPVLAIFPALGIVKTGNWLLVISNWRRQHPTTNVQSPISNLQLLITSYFITLLTGTLATGYAYFYIWAAAPGLYYANDTDLVNASRWLNTQEAQDASVYLSAIHYRHPTAAYLARDFSSSRWFTGGQALAIPNGPALYVFPHAAPPPEGWIAQWTPTAAPVGPDGSPDFRAYRFESAPPLPDFIPASANFGNLVAVTGYANPEPGVVDVRLRVLNLPDQPDYRLVADLVDVGGYHWAQAFNDSYFSEQWQAGETMLMRLSFPEQIGRPPGNYQLLVTLYSPSARLNVPAITPEGYAAAYAALGPVPFSRSAPQPIAEPLVIIGGLNMIQLEPPPITIRPGERLPFAIHWQTQSPVSNLQSLIIKLNDLIIESAAPAHNTYPVAQWLPGEIVIDRHAPRLPRDLPPGNYNVTVNDFLIGTVKVEALDRQFTPPTPSQSLVFNYQSLFELVGYDLAASSLTLYWRTLNETETDYTSFVHVLDADGRIIAQHDAQPQNGHYPTSLWAKGEYVADTIQIPTAGAAIEVGWYVAETGERLKTDEGAAVKLAP
jgi:hypothetical protein